MKENTTSLVDLLAKILLIDFRLRETDRIFDDYGRIWKMEQFDQSIFEENPEDPEGNPLIKESARNQFKKISISNDILFHVLVINLDSLREVIDILRKMNNPKVEKIHDSMKLFLGEFDNNSEKIRIWRNNIAAHGTLWGIELLGSLDITNEPTEFKKSVHYLAKLACLYTSSMTNNLTEEYKEALAKIADKWKSEKSFLIEDYFEQLQKAVKFKKNIIESLSNAGLKTNVSFAEYRSGKYIS